MRDAEVALEILNKTNDGNALTPHQLKIVELAANGLLSVRGQDMLRELYRSVGGQKDFW